MLLQMYNNGDTEAKLHLFLNPVVDVGQRWASLWDPFILIFFTLHLLF
jgi:hypothetical protein